MPFAKWIEFLTIKTIHSKKQEEKATQFDALDERFLQMPAFAIEKSRELVCDMMLYSRGAVEKAMGLIYGYDDAVVGRVQEIETLVDNYEDKLSTYFVKISNQTLSKAESNTVAKLLHCIGDIERIADHAVNISGQMKELNTKGIEFSQSAVKEIDVIAAAVTDVLNLTTDAFLDDSIETAKKVEPLEQVIDRLKLKIKNNHIERLQNQQCSIELGFILSDLLNNFARIADHCSNIAVCIIELSHGSFDVHEYLNSVKYSGGEFEEQYNEYKKQYVI